MWGYRDPSIFPCRQTTLKRASDVFLNLCCGLSFNAMKRTAMLLLASMCIYIYSFWMWSATGSLPYVKNIKDDKHSISSQCSQWSVFNSAFCLTATFRFLVSCADSIVWKARLTHVEDCMQRSACRMPATSWRSLCWTCESHEKYSRAEQVKNVKTNGQIDWQDWESSISSLWVRGCEGTYHRRRVKSR